MTFDLKVKLSSAARYRVHFIFTSK